jgi:hypothetical protein
MKRSAIAVLALVALVAAAGSALAYGGYGFMWGGGYGPGGMMRGWGPGYGGCGPQGSDFDSRSRLYNTPYGTEIPPKIAEDMRQLERTRLELQSMAYEGRIDRAKASQLHERMLSLQNEIARWQFEQWLNFSENRQ